MKQAKKLLDKIILKYYRGDLERNKTKVLIDEIILLEFQLQSIKLKVTNTANALTDSIESLINDLNAEMRFLITKN